MRILMAMLLACVASCATEKLGQAPPAGVDFTGHWKLNEADSDDPQRLLLAQNAAASQSSAPGGSGGGSSGGRGGRGGGRSGAGAMGMGGPGGPVMPSASAMADGLRWPGKQLEIKQVAGVVAFTSDGYSVVCQPMEGGHHGHHGGEGDGHDGDSSRRDAPSRSRDAPPPRCGWMEKILIVENRESEDEHPPFEEHFGLSEDSRRLVEVVDFKGGRSGGFTMSRVWDRVDH
jgi:hypothetical protein